MCRECIVRLVDMPTAVDMGAEDLPVGDRRGVERKGYMRQRTGGILPNSSNTILTLPQDCTPKIRLLSRAKMIALKVASRRRMLSAK